MNDDNYYKCRLCLEESNRNINIFKKEDFSKMIELLTGLKVDPKDGLPTNACLQCHNEVKSAMLTRYQIINSHKILLNELNHTGNDTKQRKFDFRNDKGRIMAHTSPFDEFVATDLNNYYYVESKNTNNLLVRKPQEQISQFSTQNAELLIQKDLPLKNEDSTVDCYDSDEGDEKLDYSQSINSLKIFDRTSDGSDAEVDSSEPEKEDCDQILTKFRKTQKITSQEIKFKRKRGYKAKSPQKEVQFKKKSSSDPYHIKVDYKIKPEHIEFLKTVGKKDRVACPICQREMYGMNMKNHLITHNFDPVICDICGKTSKNAQALQDHINYYHKTTPDRFMCDKCGRGYRVRFMLERHEKKEHGNGEKDYECTVCGKKFFEKLQLKNHINITHNKIKPFKCEHCGKDFGRRTQFVTHQLVHTKEYRYHCQVCGKGFKIKQTMQTHLKGVHGIEEEKIIFCKICQKGFSSAQGLRAHVNSRVHGLEKCEHCSEFITFEYKDVHLKEIHGIERKNVFS